MVVRQGSPSRTHAEFTWFRGGLDQIIRMLGVKDGMLNFETELTQLTPP